MNAENARNFLMEEKISSSMYSFGPNNRSSECYVLEHRYQGWVVYYWDHGDEIALKLYPDEESAVKAFVDKLIRLAK